MSAGSRFKKAFQKDYAIDDVGGLALLDQAVAALDAVERMQKQVAADGDLLQGSKGQPVPHPLLAAIRAERDSFARILAVIEPPEDLPSASQGGKVMALRSHAR